MLPRKWISWRFFVVLGLPLLLFGCIRFQAGTWHQGVDDPEPKSKQLVLDTRDILPGQAPGSIEIAE